MVSFLGQNFAMACEQYAQHDRVTLLQFVGGMTGNFITQVLDEKQIHQVNGINYVK
jgi:fructose-1-phosphate kinase PfkB-like protein